MLLVIINVFLEKDGFKRGDANYIAHLVSIGSVPQSTGLTVKAL